jgi:hypothetical protein
MPRETVNEAPGHEEVWGLCVLIEAFLILELDESESLNSRFVRFTPGEIKPPIPTG